MAKGKRLTTREVRPCLSTAEACRIAGVSRGALTRYAERGVLGEESATGGGDKRWTVGQVECLRLVHHMRSCGVDPDEIEAYAADGADGIRSGTRLTSIRAMRTSRRMLKNSVHTYRNAKRFEPVGLRDGYYLRYLPQRWMALMPVALDAPGLITMDEFVEGYANLNDVVDCVGWSLTLSSGTLTSMSLGGRGSTTYVFEELASPPMPFVTGSRVVDGGCYKSVQPDECPRCDAALCDRCTRFGRLPTAKELFAWRGAEYDGRVIDRAALPSRVGKPYLTGAWHDETRNVGADGRFKPPESGGMSANQNSGERLPTVVPRLMPQNCTLPLGVVACALPAGMYLCHQNDFRERDIALQQLVGVLQVLSTIDIDAEMELAMSRELARRSDDWMRRGGNAAGPFEEPFAAPRDFGDPALFGFVREVPLERLNELRLHRNAALAPENGFVVAHADVPIDTGPDVLTQELQVYVDARQFLEG